MTVFLVSTVSLIVKNQHMGIPGGSDGKEYACKAGDLGLEYSLEKGMVPYSSILAWIIPWTKEPGRLQSMGFQIWT